jgi:hypothetical protein
MRDWLKFFGFKKPSLPVSAASPNGAPDMEDASFDVRIVSGAKAWTTLQELRKQPGVVPVVFGDRNDYDNVTTVMGMGDASFEDYVRSGASLDIDQWVASRVEEDPEYYSTDGAELAAGNAQQPGLLTVVYDVMSGQPKAEVFIGLVPVQEPWQVPAYLKIGGWNECPEADIHVAFFKRWYEQFGAVVTSISSDVIEFTVERPPQTMEEARRLAHEQFIYCADIVHQGVQTESNLAQALLGSGNWFFWWD